MSFKKYIFLSSFPFMSLMLVLTASLVHCGSDEEAASEARENTNLPDRFTIDRPESLTSSSSNENAFLVEHALRGASTLRQQVDTTLPEPTSGRDEAAKIYDQIEGSARGFAPYFILIDALVEQAKSRLEGANERNFTSGEIQIDISDAFRNAVREIDPQAQVSDDIPGTLPFCYRTQLEDEDFNHEFISTMSDASGDFCSSPPSDKVRVRWSDDRKKVVINFRAPGISSSYSYNEDRGEFQTRFSLRLVNLPGTPDISELPMNARMSGYMTVKRCQDRGDNCITFLQVTKLVGLKMRVSGVADDNGGVVEMGVNNQVYQQTFDGRSVTRSRVRRSGTWEGNDPDLNLRSNRYINRGGLEFDSGDSGQQMRPTMNFVDDFQADDIYGDMQLSRDDYGDGALAEEGSLDMADSFDDFTRFRERPRRGGEASPRRDGETAPQ